MDDREQHVLLPQAVGRFMFVVCCVCVEIILLLSAIYKDISRKFKYRHNTEFRLLTDLKTEEEERIESPRKTNKSSIEKGGHRARPRRNPDDWLRAHGQTLSFVETDCGVAISMSPSKKNKKGTDRITILYLFVCGHLTA